jgi:hypothetical protein
MTPIGEELLRQPVKVMVLDGYTERTWLTAFPGMRGLLDREYTRKALIEGGRFPVSVWVRSGGVNREPRGGRVGTVALVGAGWTCRMGVVFEVLETGLRSWN